MGFELEVIPTEEAEERAADQQTAMPTSAQDAAASQRSEGTSEKPVDVAASVPCRSRFRWNRGKRSEVVPQMGPEEVSLLAWKASLHDARVRDLAWALDAENAVVIGSMALGESDVRHVDDASLSTLFPNLRSELQDLDRDPASLHKWLRRLSGENGNLVGKYFEALVFFALSHLAPSARVVLENHLIWDAEALVGEVDVIIEVDAQSSRPWGLSSAVADYEGDGSSETPPVVDSWEVGGRVPCRPLCGDRLHHLELACKFFLVASEEEEERTEGPTILRSPWSAMVGPDGDTLEWKYHKMKDVQLRRSGVAPLKDLLREDPMRWMWMYGRHFRHFSKLQQPLGIFLESRVGSLPWRCERLGGTMGWWCYEDELAACIGDLWDGAFRFLPLRKPYWLAPIAFASTHPDFGPPVTATQLLIRRAQLVRQGTAKRVLIAVVAAAGQSWIEVHRGFVVPRSWPQTVS